MTVHQNACILNVKAGEKLIKQIIVKLTGKHKKEEKIIKIDFHFIQKKTRKHIFKNKIIFKYFHAHMYLTFRRKISSIF
jgi:ribosomal protein S7